MRGSGRRIGAITPLVLLLSLIPAATPLADVRERPCSPAWTVTDTPDPDPLNSSLTAVDSRTSSDIWAVGYRSLGAQSAHWDGDSWTAVPMPVPDGAVSMGAHDVVSVGAAEAWAVGSYSGSDSGAHPFVQRWDGAAWSMVPIADLQGTFGQLFGIDAVSPDEMWAIGYTAGGSPGGAPKPLVLHHDGGGWHRVETPVPPGSNSSLWDVRALAIDDVWAVGSRQPRAGSSVGDRTLIMHWDGSAWTVVPSPEVDDQSHGLTTVDGSGPNDVWAAGSIAGYRPVMEHWDGASWTIVETGLADETAASAGIQDVEVLSDHNVWALAGRSAGRSLIAHYDGEVWSPAPGPPGAQRFPADLDSTPDGDVWAVGAVRGSHRQASLAERLCPSRPSTSGFLPEVVTTPYGTGIAWSVPEGDGGTYRLVDATGLGLFDSGPLTATDTFARHFPVSGTYAVADPTSGTTQTIRVRPAARERSRLGAGTIRVIWAAGWIPSGLVADVQVRRPGRGGWEVLTWRTERVSAFFEADASEGRYAFRARLRDPATGARAGWSPPAHVAID